MQENPPNFLAHPGVGPLGMAVLHESRFMGANRPVELLRRFPALRWRHPAEDLDLFGTELLVRQHHATLAPAPQPIKLRALARASSIFEASLPPPRAKSGLPPPFPPTIGAIAWMIFPA